MHEWTRTGGDPEDGTVQRLELPADRVDAGDTVVYTSELNKEYVFVVADVDTEWITFETGQMVHVDRFEREPFEVVRTGEEESTSPVEERAGPGGTSRTAGRPTPNAE